LARRFLSGLFVVLYGVWAIIILFRSHAGEESPPTGTQSVLDFVVNTIDGEPRALSEYSGKVLLIVNTASKCGFTPQYAGLERLYRTYKNRGFAILAFPANDFLWQEPGTNEEIRTFCTLNYDVTFDLFAKIHVKGKDKHPLYKYITEESPLPGEIKWNFQKYLVNQRGEIVARVDPSVEPMSQEISSKVEELLSEPVQ